VIIGKPLEKMTSKADLSKLGFDVTLKNEVYFPFSLSNGKKGASIEVHIKNDFSGLIAEIHGEFEVKLRPGAERGFTGGKSDLRLKAVTWNGGNWNGFEAFPVGIDGQKDLSTYFKSLPKVTKYELK
jgi:hypothetical protein